ncbi:hypothetical protein GQ600_17035 [Phytophthora cactorum]|nr:hypothetical protein GQ600_17035 [Phytophthora cactorum]
MREQGLRGSLLGSRRQRRDQHAGAVEERGARARTHRAVQARVDTHAKKSWRRENLHPRSIGYCRR